MRYFKIKHGYAETEYLPIDETELETALYVFMTDSKGVFKNGVVRGKDIIAIQEDWHTAAGWNKGHVMEAEDWAFLRQTGAIDRYRGVLGQVKEKVEYLMKTGQQHLIGKNAEVEGFRIEEPRVRKYEGMKSIGEIAK